MLRAPALMQALAVAAQQPAEAGPAVELQPAVVLQQAAAIQQAVALQLVAVAVRPAAVAEMHSLLSKDQRPSSAASLRPPRTTK